MAQPGLWSGGYFGCLRVASWGPESGLGVETELLDSLPFVFSPVRIGILYLELVVASGLISK